MIKQLQMGFKLLKYTHGIVINMVSLLFTMGVGILFELVSHPTPNVGGNVINNVGAYFVLISALYILQMLISLNVPNVVAVSPWKKRIQTSVFGLTAGVSFGVAFLVLLVVKMYRYSSGLISYEEFVTGLLGMPLMIIFVLVYMAFSLKYFVAATIVFVFTLPIAMGIQDIGLLLGWFSFENVTIGMAIALCLASVLLGAVLSYGILQLLYRKPISKYSQMNSLKKKM